MQHTVKGNPVVHIHTPVSWHQPSPFWFSLATVLTWRSSRPPGPAATSKPL